MTCVFCKAWPRRRIGIGRAGIGTVRHADACVRVRENKRRARERAVWRGVRVCWSSQCPRAREPNSYSATGAVFLKFVKSTIALAQSRMCQRNLECAGAASSALTHAKRANPTEIALTRSGVRQRNIRCASATYQRLGCQPCIQAVKITAPARFQLRQHNRARQLIRDCAGAVECANTVDKIALAQSERAGAVRVR